MANEQYLGPILNLINPPKTVKLTTIKTVERAGTWLSCAPWCACRIRVDHDHAEINLHLTEDRRDNRDPMSVVMQEDVQRQLAEIRGKGNGHTKVVPSKFD